MSNLSEEEKEVIEKDISARLCDYVYMGLNVQYKDKELYVLQTIIEKLQNELDKEKENNEELEEIYNRAMKEYNTAKGFNEVLKNKLKKQKDDIRSLHIENQALYESINCNDDNMLARKYKKLKDKIKAKKEFLDECIDLQWASTNYNEIEVEKYQYALEIIEDLLKEN